MPFVGFNVIVGIIYFVLPLSDDLLHDTDPMKLRQWHRCGRFSGVMWGMILNVVSLVQDGMEAEKGNDISRYSVN